MTDDFFDTRIAEARDRIGSLPEDQRAPLMAILAETIERHAEMRQNFARIHDAVSEWQLMVKYLIFDREATIRERDELRRELDRRDK